jgi:O-antigen ligase
MIFPRFSALWIAPCVAAAIPLVIAPGFLYYYDVTPKVVLLYAGAAATLLLVSPRRLLAHTPGRWFGALLAAAWISLLISSLFSVRTDLSIFGTNWRRFGLITQSALLLFVFAVAADLSVDDGSDRMKRTRAYLRASTLATILVALYGILQYFGWDPCLDPNSYHIGTGTGTIVRPPGTLGYVTYFANYLVFGAFQGLALRRLEDEAAWRWLGVVGVALAVTAIVLSGTRAAILALLAGALVILWKEGRLPSMRTAGILAAAAAVVVGFYFSPAGLPLRSRMRWFQDDPAGGARLYLWRDSLPLLGRHWLVGSGPETFSVEFPKVQSRDLSRAFPEFYHESAHNMFLDAGTAQGLPGLLILLATTVLGLRMKAAKNPALAAGFVAILVCQQFSVFTLSTALTFWLTLAMLMTSDAQPSTAATVKDRRMPWLLPVSLALIVAAVRLAIGDRYLAQMRGTLNQADFVAAGAWGAHADLWYSRKLLALGRPQEAVASGISATKTAEDPYNAWMNLGLVYATLNDAGQTEHCIREAIAASPNWYKPHLALAQLLLATNRRVEAEKELRIAKDLNPRVPA